MRIIRLALAAALLAVPSFAQINLTITTPSGTVPRIPVPLFIPRCPTTPNPYYFAITGSTTQVPPVSQEIRMYVRPRLADGSLIPGCNWVNQCQRAFVLPDNSYRVIGQFGGNDTPRPFFAGQQADIQFILVDLAANVPNCLADPAAVGISASNVITINTNNNTPTLHDYQAPCTGSVMDVQGDPTPGNLMTWTLPSAGGVIIGPVSFTGFPVLGCTAWLGFPIEFVSTDGAGVLNLRLPASATLLGVDLGSQGAVLANGRVDLTQPTLVQIR